ncbi:phosphoribosylaminoimidazolesuccinocarboxamide synthase [Aeoliella sp. ICT_H6.2]|uniref:Phosphoribosylaminoimidazole-succinocarboxamide synthase n=1 Tax=Aeoliella straminimaris TaxID=2954799 RepID=A0A9X2FBV7_9BACT|nr:phosphoribosylaminoimidazolesuccinocarboxamide synthase [Aeoliella straminimaris]MCO6043489.1 phosphoribosylaminoimidazolesuccinocarboxamide synthase [Aeoliella straminimaris]
MHSTPLIDTQLADIPARHGKVRDVYDLGEHLLLVATDRISAFDWVLPTGIPDKGRVLTGVSQFWFDQLDTPHHLVTTEVDQMPLPDGVDREVLRGRVMLTKKAQVVPMECVVRGYLAGSGWKEYQQSGTVCGVQLPSGLVESDRLPEPIFTPATKAEMGEHDENISFERMAAEIGTELAEELKARSIELFNKGSAHAEKCGLLLADTKYEFGHADGELILIDEVMTPDSSRYWPADQYQPGGPQPSFDKQFVRDWLLASDWDRNSTPPELPEEIVEKTRAKYIEAFERISGGEFAWK